MRWSARSQGAMSLLKSERTTSRWLDVDHPCSTSLSNTERGSGLLAIRPYRSTSKSVKRTEDWSRRAHSGIMSLWSEDTGTGSGLRAITSLMSLRIADRATSWTAAAMSRSIAKPERPTSVWSGRNQKGTGPSFEKSDSGSSAGLPSIMARTSFEKAARDTAPCGRVAHSCTRSFDMSVSRTSPSPSARRRSLLKSESRTSPCGLVAHSSRMSLEKDDRYTCCLPKSVSMSSRKPDSGTVCWAWVAHGCVTSLEKADSGVRCAVAMPARSRSGAKPASPTRCCDRVAHSSTRSFERAVRGIAWLERSPARSRSW